MLIVQLVCISMLLSSLDRSAAFSFTAGVCSLARVASVHETALRVQLPDQAERDRAMDNERDRTELAFGVLGVTTRDYARFGWLMLNDGLSPATGERLVSEAWVRAATTPATKFRAT